MTRVVAPGWSRAAAAARGFRRALGVVVCALIVPACGTNPTQQVSPEVYSPAHRTAADAAREFFNIRSRVEQPIPFPHKTHIAKKAECVDCHESVEKGPIAGIPSVKTCMICHSQIATDRPLIKQVTKEELTVVSVSRQR